MRAIAALACGSRSVLEVFWKCSGSRAGDHSLILSLACLFFLFFWFACLFARLCLCYMKRSSEWLSQPLVLSHASPSISGGKPGEHDGVLHLGSARRQGRVSFGRVWWTCFSSPKFSPPKGPEGTHLEFTLQLTSLLSSWKGLFCTSMLAGGRVCPPIFFEGCSNRKTNSAKCHCLGLALAICDDFTSVNLENGWENESLPACSFCGTFYLGSAVQEDEELDSVLPSVLLHEVALSHVQSHVHLLPACRVPTSQWAEPCSQSSGLLFLLLAADSAGLTPRWPYSAGAADICAKTVVAA